MEKKGHAAQAYPFGLTFNESVRVASVDQDFLFAGKEAIEETDWYDFGARMYNPSIARWNGIDASSENYINQSPYHYSGNNPILFVDFDGNDYGVSVDQKSKTITIKAKFLVSSRNKAAFDKRGAAKWNAQSGKNVFVSGGVKALKRSLKNVKGSKMLQN